MNPQLRFTTLGNSNTFFWFRTLWPILRWFSWQFQSLHPISPTHRIGLWENLQESPIFDGKTMVSCKFSLKPIQWPTFSPPFLQLPAVPEASVVRLPPAADSEPPPRRPAAPAGPAPPAKPAGWHGWQVYHDWTSYSYVYVCIYIYIWCISLCNAWYIFLMIYTVYKYIYICRVDDIP